MLQREFLDNLERSARATKENITRKRPADISTYIVVHRGDDPVALITLARADRDAMLTTAKLCAGGFEADSLGLVFETYETRPNADGSITNPLTGQFWQQDEMNDAVRHHDALGKGWISEAVSLCAVNRAGDLGMRNLLYRYVGGKHLSWQESQDWTDTVKKGIVPDALTEAMLSPTPGQLFDLPDTLDERDKHVAKVLLSKGHAVLMYANATDTERRRTFGTGWRPL